MVSAGSESVSVSRIERLKLAPARPSGKARPLATTRFRPPVASATAAAVPNRFSPEMRSASGASAPGPAEAAPDMASDEPTTTAAAATVIQRFEARELRVVKGVPPVCGDAGNPEVPGSGLTHCRPFGLRACFNSYNRSRSMSVTPTQILSDSCSPHGWPRPSQRRDGPMQAGQSLRSLAVQGAKSTSPPPGMQDVHVPPGNIAYLRSLLDRGDYMVYSALNELRSRQMTSLLGNLWHLLNPLLQIGVYFVVFGLILQVDRGDNYLAFLSIGIFVFGFTQRSTMSGAGSIQNNKGLLNAFSFPRALLPGHVDAHRDVRHVRTGRGDLHRCAPQW